MSWLNKWRGEIFAGKGAEKREELFMKLRDVRKTWGVVSRWLPSPSVRYYYYLAALFCLANLLFSTVENSLAFLALHSRLVSRRNLIETRTVQHTTLFSPSKTLSLIRYFFRLSPLHAYFSGLNQALKNLSSSNETTSSATAISNWNCFHQVYLKNKKLFRIYYTKEHIWLNKNQPFIYMAFQKLIITVPYLSLT